MSYEITFTRGFKDGFEALPSEAHSIVGRQLDWLRSDPFAKNPNATRMKNARNAFRMKIGSHLRMLYQVYTKQRRVELSGIGARENFYAGRHGSATPLTAAEAAAIRAEIQAAKPRAQPQAPAAIGGPQAETGIQLDVVVEVRPWIGEDELFMLHVPRESWPTICGVDSIEALLTSELEAETKSKIEDYWTDPHPTQVERLYSLSTGQGASAIAQLPLSHFLVALDPEQKQALERLKGDGPYLLKGGAGTGKSLVGLYHMRDLLISRAADSLFDDHASPYGVVTYTNTLVDANDSLLRAITPESAHRAIHCSTLDKIARDLTELALRKRPNALRVEGVAKWIREQVLPAASSVTSGAIERLGADFVADEIEQTIFGNGLENLGDYLAQDRRGRKRGLREAERRAIWEVFEVVQRLCVQWNVQTFEERRLIALRYLQTHPEYPRFAALFVDEAQDFSRVARQLCLELVADPKNLLLAADTGQAIYTVPPTWRATDSRLDFQRRRPIVLERSYRATREIGQAIARLRLDPGDEDDRSGDSRPVFSGPKPRWIDAPVAEHAHLVAEEILRMIDNSSSPINAGQFAIIVRTPNRADPFVAALSARKIESAIVDKQTRLDLEGKHVHVVAAPSAKGLGFPIVFVPEVHDLVYPLQHFMDKANDDDQRGQVEESEQRILYVSLSRGSHQLFMIVDTDQPSRFVKKHLDRSLHWS